MKRVLVINSYAGSLMLGAHQAKGVRVVGSYEDTGYGIQVQKNNFPTFKKFVDKLPWPEQNLRGVTVIAHPPCSAFSMQTVARQEVSGPEAEAFSCTIRLMNYALGLDCETLIIESVIGALEGAMTAHETCASEHGYNIFRILLNACTFGVPQWRPRFWCIFSKEKRLHLNYHPKIRTLRDVFDEYKGLHTYCPSISKEWNWQMNELYMNLALSRKKILKEITRRTGQQWHQIFGVPLRKFTCKNFRCLNPDSVSTTLMADSHWCYKGQLLSVEQYKLVMGFPPDYKMPVSLTRIYLSKGVCPPVARWILDNVGVLRGNYTIAAGETLDLRPKLKEIFK